MVGILLVNVGTPDEPTTPALRRYLRQFLGDPRIIEAPRWLWWIILNFFILPFRPAKSAEKYRRVWHAKTGSPLRHYTVRQVEELQKRFPHCMVRYGMQIANPSVESVLNDMVKAGVDRVIVVPMYPQYSATTTAGAMDCIGKAVLKMRRVPAIRTVPPYYNHPRYLDAMTALVKDGLAKLPWKPDHIVFSFHGIPQKYAQRGDPYATHVTRTTRELVKRLELPRSYWSQTYQSLFGRDEWLKPYTDATLEKMAKNGVKKVFVVLPGFTADCLETIDEIGTESLENFHHAGGEDLKPCACLNDHPEWIAALADIVRDEGRGWIN